MLLFLWFYHLICAFIGVQGRFDHPYISFLFYGMDSAGDFIPIKQLREKYNKPRHEIPIDPPNDEWRRRQSLNYQWDYILFNLVGDWEVESLLTIYLMNQLIGFAGKLKDKKTFLVLHAQWWLPSCVITRIFTCYSLLYEFSYSMPLSLSWRYWLPT